MLSVGVIMGPAWGTGQTTLERIFEVSVETLSWVGPYVAGSAKA